MISSSDNKNYSGHSARPATWAPSPSLLFPAHEAKFETIAVSFLKNDVARNCTRFRGISLCLLGFWRRPDLPGRFVAKREKGLAAESGPFQRLHRASCAGSGAVSTPECRRPDAAPFRRASLLQSSERPGRKHNGRASITSAGQSPLRRCV